MRRCHVKMCHQSGATAAPSSVLTQQISQRPALSKHDNINPTDKQPTSCPQGPHGRPHAHVLASVTTAEPHGCTHDSSLPCQALGGPAVTEYGTLRRSQHNTREMTARLAWVRASVPVPDVLPFSSRNFLHLILKTNVRKPASEIP